MKMTIYSCLILFLLSGISVLISCENEKGSDITLQTLEFSANLINVSDCKRGLKSSLDAENTADSFILR